MKAQDSSGAEFRRARFEAATRLARPEFMGMEAAAAAIGISVSALKKYESGERRPSFEMLETMANAYGVLMGDLLPSSAPRGPQVDAILAPLSVLPPLQREAFITQMSAMARMLGSAITTAVDSAVMSRIDESARAGVSSASPSLHHDHQSGVPGLSRALEPQEGDGDEETFNAQRQRSLPSTKTPRTS
jgi:transcriptional regulator with XRE-family HTH domain